MPSSSAFAIIPRWRLSARNTWQRLHNVLKLLMWFVPRLPETIWSMWHSSRLTGSPWCWQIPPSRSQTLRRVSCHISLGCRFLGIRFPCLAPPCPAQPRPALPGPAMPRPAMPRRETPASWPRPTMDAVRGNPCQTLPHLALPDRATPRHAYPRRARPNLARFAELTVGDSKLRDLKPAHTDVAAIAHAAETPGVNGNTLHLAAIHDRAIPLNGESSRPSRRCGHAIAHVARLRGGVDHAAHVKIDRRVWVIRGQIGRAHV